MELDGELARVLRAEFSGNPNVEVVQQDFLRFELPHTPYKVFGSIPFARTADIVRRLVNDAAPPDEAYLIVQREAAERFAGTPYAPETLASLLLKPWWHTEIVRRLRRTDFDPPPSVDSVVLWLLRRDRPLVTGSEHARYTDFVTASFGRRGDSVARCVRGVFTRPQIARLARDLRFDPRAAPSALSFDQWLGLYRFGGLTPGPSPATERGGRQGGRG